MAQNKEIHGNIKTHKILYLDVTMKKSLLEGFTMNNSMLKPTVKLLSGAYSSSLWDNLCDVLENENSPSQIYEALEGLHSAKKDKEAFSLVQVLHDLVGLDLPDEIVSPPGYN